jgi:hypothetical protein
MALLTYIEKATLKFVWKYKLPLKVSTKNNAEDIIGPDFKLYYKTTKKAWHWH